MRGREEKQRWVQIHRHGILIAGTFVYARMVGSGFHAVTAVMKSLDDDDHS